MQGKSSPRVTNSLTNVRPTGDSTTSLTMDDDGIENNGNDDNSNSNSDSHQHERKTRRFAWPDELHRLFVAAIFDLGLKNASPKALMPFMQPAATNAGLTTEHLKSHLQKYRLNYDKSRAEFLAFFDESAKRNGRRRRRTAKSNESHTRFIFPITPGASGDPAVDGLSETTIQSPITLDSVSTPHLPYAHSQGTSLALDNRLDRVNSLRLAQQNAAMAFVEQSVAGAYGSEYSPRDRSQLVDNVPDAQWGMLASMLAPQGEGALDGEVLTPVGYSLNDETSLNREMQMHLALQAQMNLHREMLTRKVAVSQFYYNQAAALKRAATSAMIKHELPPPPHHQIQQEHDDHPSRHNNLPITPPTIGEGGMQQYHTHHYQYHLQLVEQQQQLQRYAASSQADALLRPPWDDQDAGMNIDAEDQSDLFDFLRSTNE